MAFAQTFTFGGPPPATYGADLALVKANPGFILNAQEINGLYSSIREISGSTWMMQNADWNGTGFQQINAGLPSFAFVLIGGGGLAMYTAVPGSGTGFAWTRKFFVDSNGVLQSGVSSILTLSYTSLNQYAVDPLGVTDSVSGINAAMAAAVAAGNYSIYVPPGFYRCASTLQVTGAMQFWGLGQVQGGYNGSGAATAVTKFVADNMGYDLLWVNGVNYGFDIRGIGLAVKNKTNTGGYAMRITSCQRVRVRDMQVSQCWHGIVNDSSGDIKMWSVDIAPADIINGTGLPRYGFVCTNISSGNPNETLLYDCSVGQIGQVNNKSVDAFVIAHGYNSLSLISCGCSQVNRSYWSSNAYLGGAAGNSPNFFVANGFTSDTCNAGIVLDDGGYTQFSNGLITSCNAPISIGASFSTSFGLTTPPVSFNMVDVIASNGPAVVFNASSARISWIGGRLSGITGAGFQFKGAGNQYIIISGILFENVTGTVAEWFSGFTGSVVVTGFTQRGANKVFRIQSGMSGFFTITAGACASNAVDSYEDAAGLGTSHVGSVVRGVNGLNPVGVMTPAGLALAYGTTFTNTYAFDMTVYIYGANMANVTSVGIGWPGGSPNTVAGSFAAGANYSFRWPVGGTFVLTGASSLPLAVFMAE